MQQGEDEEEGAMVLLGWRAASSSKLGGSELTRWLRPPFFQHFQNEASVPQRRRRSGAEWWGGGGERSWMGGGGWPADEGGAVLFCGLQGEGELGPGLALAEDDFLLLLLLPLPVLLQLHALLVDLSLLFHNTQLILSQFGLSLCDLAVILLQDFFQLLPLRFFFFLNKQHDDMLAHEQATKGTHAHAHSHTHDKFVQPLTHF